MLSIKIYIIKYQTLMIIYFMYYICEQSYMLSVKNVKIIIVNVFFIAGRSSRAEMFEQKDARERLFSQLNISQIFF